MLLNKLCEVKSERAFPLNRVCVDLGILGWDASECTDRSSEHC
jgi:hypothetical protein